MNQRFLPTFFAIAVLTALAVPGVVAAASKAPRPVSARPGAGYVGASSQSTGSAFLHRPVSFRVSKDGTTVTRYDIQWDSPCVGTTGRKSYSGLAITRNKKISPAGGFADANTFSTKFSPVIVATFKVSLTGNFLSPKKAKGTFRVTVTTVDASGKHIEDCDSGNVTWTASD